MSKTAKEIIAALKEKYKDDADALEEIERREKDIAYIEEKIQAGNYDGQTPESMAKMLQADLKYWY